VRVETPPQLNATTRGTPQTTVFIPDLLKINPVLTVKKIDGTTRFHSDKLLRRVQGSAL